MISQYSQLVDVTQFTMA